MAQKAVAQEHHTYSMQDAGAKFLLRPLSSDTRIFSCSISVELNTPEEIPVGQDISHLALRGLDPENQGRLQSDGHAHFF